MGEIIEILRETPLPTLLVVAGLSFLLISLITLKKPIVIELDDAQRRFARIIGAIIFIVGLLLYTVPPLSSPLATAAPDQSESTASPTETPKPTETPVPPTPTLLPPKLTLAVLHIGFTDPNSRPPQGQTIEVPRLSEVELTTQNVIPGRYFLWMLACKKVGQNEPEFCTIKELPLDLSESYHDTVSIGENSQADDCAYFHMEFVIVGTKGNSQFEAIKPEIRYANIPREDFAASNIKEVYRVLQNNGIEKIACGLSQ